MRTVEPIGDPAFSKDKSAIPRNYWLLSTDEKPMDAANGSRAAEIDTGNVFCFDAENKIWHQW